LSSISEKINSTRLSNLAVVLESGNEYSDEDESSRRRGRRRRPRSGIHAGKGVFSGEKRRERRSAECCACADEIEDEFELEDDYDLLG
jgi:hypothetical protein